MRRGTFGCLVEGCDWPMRTNALCTPHELNYGGDVARWRAEGAPVPTREAWARQFYGCQIGAGLHGAHARSGR